MTIQEKGLFILLAGANASGKSTVIKPKYVEGRVKHYLDPDRLLPIAEKDILSDKARKVYTPESPGRFAVACMGDWLASERIRNEGIATESNLVAKRDGDNFATAKKAGMRTELYFVGLPLETAKEREVIRVAERKQDKIDHNTLEQRYKNGLPKIQKHIDSGNIDLIKIYDNGRGIGEEKLVFHMENGITIFMNPEPILQWFQDAKSLNPNIKIPSFLEEQ